MKWLIFSSFLILSVIAVLSLFLLRRQLHPILIIYGIFIATILNDQFFTIFGFNLQLFTPAPGWIPYIIKNSLFCGALSYTDAMAYVHSVLACRSFGAQMVSVATFNGIPQFARLLDRVCQVHTTDKLEPRLLIHPQLSRKRYRIFTIGWDPQTAVQAGGGRMILYPPVRFDLNEWFVIAASVHLGGC